MNASYQHLGSNNMGFKQSETVTGDFATSIYELNRSYLHQLEAQDQQIVKDEQSKHIKTNEGVDLIKFIKTNRFFYSKMILLWLKFKTVHEERLLRMALDK
jgi:hypothetical protein